MRKQRKIWQPFRLQNEPSTIKPTWISHHVRESELLISSTKECLSISSKCVTRPLLQSGLPCRPLNNVKGHFIIIIMLLLRKENLRTLKVDVRRIFQEITFQCMRCDFQNNVQVNAFGNRFSPCTHQMLFGYVIDVERLKLFFFPSPTEDS